MTMAGQGAIIPPPRVLKQCPAHSKFTGEIGVCLATSGPRAAHLLTGLYNARADHMSVPAIVGQQARTALRSHYQQQIDLVSMFSASGAYRL